MSYISKLASDIASLGHGVKKNVNFPRDHKLLEKGFPVYHNTFKSVGNELIFKCKGPFATCEIIRSESDGITEFIKNPDKSQIIQGEFSLKNLGYFIKCTNLCNSIEMFLENDLPLVVKYSVASLGEIKLCLAPLPST